MCSAHGEVFDGLVLQPVASQIIRRARVITMPLACIAGLTGTSYEHGGSLWQQLQDPGAAVDTPMAIALR